MSIKVECEVRFSSKELDRYVGNEGPVLKAVAERIQCSEVKRKGDRLIFTIIGERAVKAHSDQDELNKLGKQIYNIVKNTLAGLGK